MDFRGYIRKAAAIARQWFQWRTHEQPQKQTSRCGESCMLHRYDRRHYTRAFEAIEAQWRTIDDVYLCYDDSCNCVEYRSGIGCLLLARVCLDGNAHGSPMVIVYSDLITTQEKCLFIPYFMPQHVIIFRSMAEAPQRAH